MSRIHGTETLSMSEFQLLKTFTINDALYAIDGSRIHKIINITGYNNGALVQIDYYIYSKNEMLEYASNTMMECEQALLILDKEISNDKSDKTN